MYRIKNAVLVIDLVMMMAITIYALIALFAEGFAWAWLGAMMTTVPFLAFLGRVMVRQDLARTSANLPALLGLGLIGVGVAIYGYSEGEPLMALILASLGFGGFLIYDFWFSRLGRSSSSALAKGQELPAFELENQQGQTVNSHDFKGRPALFIFFRGNWCPLCMAQIREVAAEYRDLDAHGVQVILISPQPHGHTKELASRFDVPFEFLVDRDNRAAEQLGIAMKGGTPIGMGRQGYDEDTVLPTVFITDAEGTIIFCDETDNYRVRPEPRTFIRALEEHGITASAGSPA
ncbi:MAG: peroxiredoxin family protein [Alphaproteobacteria bacterium]|nr:peroxiredoxin family protein [Alphaproteobacteria bacterium]